MTSEFYKDMEDKKKRENNIVLYGLTPNVNCTDDLLVTEMATNALHINVQVISTLRVGKSVIGKPRILIATLQNASQVQNVLQNAKYLKGNTAYPALFIFCDRTKKEQEEFKQLRVEYNRRRLAGENVYIRGNNIVQRVTNSILNHSCDMSPSILRVALPPTYSSTSSNNSLQTKTFGGETLVKQIDSSETPVFTNSIIDASAAK
jgi:hypothetical protein